MEKNSFKGWCVKEPSGQIRQSVYWSKIKAIDDLTGLSSKKLYEANKRRGLWREAYKNGWRVVPVLVIEITGGEAVGDAS